MRVDSHNSFGQLSLTIINLGQTRARVVETVKSEYKQEKTLINSHEIEHVQSQ